MNKAFENLIDAYVFGSTGTLMLYYDMNTFGVENGSGYVKNVSPSSTVGYNNAFLDSGKNTGMFRSGNYSGCNLAYSKLTIDSFNNGFLNTGNTDWYATFLFSFTKTHQEDGVLFGCLNKDTIDYYGLSGTYGRGFNIGVNDRNQLFFQGIDFEQGPYIITSDSFELANKNLCSVVINPSNVSFGYYDLGSDRFYEQTKITNINIENIFSNEKFYIGGSNFYYKNPSFSGYIDNFAILSGDYHPSTLKSLMSGFVSMEIIDTGSLDFSSLITGYEIEIIQETGITGYVATLTGSKNLYTTGYFFERVPISSSNSTPIVEGNRIITGYSLANGIIYNEEIGNIYVTDQYVTSGNDAHATLGLISELLTFQTGGKTLLKYKVNQTGVLPLYRLDALTGFIGPTGLSIDPLTQQQFIEGSTGYDYVLNTGLMNEYQHNYIYYLSERL
jgi:hypothetical protein